MHPLVRVTMRTLAILVVHEIPLWLAWMGQAHGSPWPNWDLFGFYQWIDQPAFFCATNGSSDYAVIVAGLFQWGGLEWLVLVLIANAISFKRWYLVLLGIYIAILLGSLVVFYLLPLAFI